MKKVALYVRVSTKDQNPAMQVSDLRRYAQQRDFEIFNEYVDVGISGTKASRPALDALMDSARKRLFDVVLVWRFDRFARSTKHLVDALHEFRSLGINFISYQEAIDTSSPMGEAMYVIIGAMAKLERDIIVERVKAGMRKAKEQGKRIGRPKAVVDVSKIISLREQGLSLQAISERVKYQDSKGRMRNVSKGKVHRILTKHGLTNLDLIGSSKRKTCTFQISAYIVDNFA
ncbi:MAG: recombinase family protein [Deltaproteobacteria bacterium]|nr:recombinase family protein [Deltaproteobacteria bacterium]